jgi:hypothetical protein
VKFIDNWYLIVVALASGSMLLWPVLRSAVAGSLTPTGPCSSSTAKRRWSSTCAKPRVRRGHVGGAKNVPLGQLEERLPTLVKNKAVPW